MTKSKLNLNNEEYSDLIHNPENALLNNETKVDDDVAPEDRYNLVYWILFLQGTGVLFPWNSFISAPDYFITVYKNPQILSIFSIIYSYPNIVGLFFMVLFGHKFNIKLRILLSYFVCIILISFLPIMAIAQIPENYPAVGMYTTYVCLGFIACFTSILQGSIFGLAGYLPWKYIVAAMSGNGMAGVLVSAIRVVSKLIIERNGGKPTIRDMSISTSIYFFVSTLILILCFITFIIMMRTPFIQFYIRKSQKPTLVHQDSFSVIERGNVYETNKKSAMTKILDNFKLIFRVTKKIWVFEILVLFTFTVTIGLFPSFLGYIKSSGTKTMENWLPIILICTFNIFDLIGRASPEYFTISKGNLIIGVLGRSLFVILFVLCVRPKVFKHDLLPITFMAMMAFTNGFFSSLSMMFAPAEVEDDEKEITGTIMTFLLVGGIMMGANLGTLLTWFF